VCFGFFFGVFWCFLAVCARTGRRRSKPLRRNTTGDTQSTVSFALPFPRTRRERQQNRRRKQKQLTVNQPAPRPKKQKQKQKRYSAPFSPDELVQPEQLPHMDPSKVLVVTTGSQAEPRAQLSLASQSLSHNLKIAPSDLVLYSAKVIPGNEGKVTQMINSLCGLGAEVAAGRAEGLHTSGHAYQDELTVRLLLFFWRFCVSFCVSAASPPPSVFGLSAAPSSVLCCCCSLSHSSSSRVGRSCQVRQPIQQPRQLTNPTKSKPTPNQNKND